VDRYETNQKIEAKLRRPSCIFLNKEVDQVNSRLEGGLLSSVWILLYVAGLDVALVSR
jgi:hypothetical protein